MKGLTFRIAVFVFMTSPGWLLALPTAPMPKAVPDKESKEKIEATGEPVLLGVTTVPWLAEVKAKNVPAAKSLRWQVFVKNKDGDYVLAVGKVQKREVPVEKAFFFAGPPAEYLVLCSFDKGNQFIELEWRGTLTGGLEPSPGPGPKPPDPKPPEPKPSLVTSFRVFIVYESADTLTPAQRGVVFGKVVEDWLNANATGGKAGWRRRDKDSPGDNDPAMKSFWEATQKHITTTPCVAVAVTREWVPDVKVDIIPLEPTPAAMVAKLQSYKK